MTTAISSGPSFRAEACDTYMTDSHILTNPIGLFKVTEAWAKAHLHQDNENLIDLTGKITGYIDSGLSWVYSPLQLLGSVASHYGTLPAWHELGIIAKMAIAPYAGAFFVLAAVELFFEGTNLLRSIRLIKRLSNQMTPIQKLQNLQERFFALKPNEKLAIERLAADPTKTPEEVQAKINRMTEKTLQVKYAQLARRISPWCAEKLAKAVNRIDVLAEKEIQDILDTVAIQAKKRIILHIVAILSILFAVVATVLILIACPITGIALAFSIVSTLLLITHYLIENGMMSQKGWAFSPKACIPRFLQKTETITPQPVAV
jgi:hypothetical protein